MYIEVKMRIFNFHIMFKKTLGEKRRESEKFGHQRAFADFGGADKIFYGYNQVLRDSRIEEKLVILGDGALVANNIFTGSDTMLEIH